MRCFFFFFACISGEMSNICHFVTEIRDNLIGLLSSFLLYLKIHEILIAIDIVTSDIGIYLL